MSNTVHTILIVDDDMAVRSFSRLVLERAGYDVIEAGNGLDALRRWEEHGSRIGLVVTDLIMPGMAGLELAACLRQLRPGLGVVFVSGYGEDQLGLDLGGANGAGFLQKPFTPKQLLTVVRQQLDLTAA